MPKEKLMQFAALRWDDGGAAGEGTQDHGRAWVMDRDKRLKVKVVTRDFQAFKDPAVLLVDQLNQIYFEAELEIIEFDALVRPHRAWRTMPSSSI